jgi:hypothetical protein
MIRTRIVKVTVLLAGAFALLLISIEAAQARVVGVRSTIQAAVDAARPARHLPRERPRFD